jgi:hypothetical protein
MLTRPHARVAGKSFLLFGMRATWIRLNRRPVGDSNTPGGLVLVARRDDRVFIVAILKSAGATPNQADPQRSCRL